ncbi:hypothetical protein [Helicobacter ailurogastricus]|uniref:hypothetical protein n=1 Tax=Helicobacter ailurogastricus TaxID=1578720 RepID=UPI00244D9722|nr:hypothetical protein [Helicobacter ailurogastricus]GMB91851.1 hypothetical protein NHP190009_10240 [Helicobacter ailurogastricus]
MSKKAILAGALCGWVFWGCSVYQSSDPESNHKHQKEQLSQKNKEQLDEQAKVQAEENRALEQQIEQLKSAVTTDEHKMNALDTKLKTPPKQPAPKPQAQHKPQPQPQSKSQPQPQSKPQPQPQLQSKPKTISVVQKGGRFLVGYGVSDDQAKTPEDARESAYFNARRQLTFSIYNNLSQTLSAHHLKSEHLKNVLLLSIDKAIDSTQVYKEKTIVPLARYDKTFTILLVDSAVFDRLRQLVHAQYNFSTDHRYLFDRLLYGVQAKLLH